MSRLQKSPIGVWLLTLAVFLQTEPAGQVEDLGIRQVQDWNQDHRWMGLSQGVSQTFFKSWQAEVGRERQGVRVKREGSVNVGH